MGRALGDLCSLADLDDLPAIHHGDARRQIADHRHGMRDKEVGESEVALQLRQQIDDLSADAYVERGHGFVAHHELGTEREGSSDSDALALSSRKFVRIACSRGFIKAHGAQQFRNAPANL